MNDQEALINYLIRRDHALTVIAAKDHGHAHRLHNALSQGVDELFFWGVGPKLSRGSIVPLYIPEKSHLPLNMTKRVNRIYVTASNATPNETGNKSSIRHSVFLYRGVSLDPPIVFKDFERAGILTGPEIRNAGKSKNPWSAEKAAGFWRLVLGRQPSLGPLIRSRFVDFPDKERVAISYSGIDRLAARRLLTELEAQGVSAFYVTSTGRLEDYEHQPLRAHLKEVFENCRVSLFLQPSNNSETEWTVWEQECAKRNNGYVIKIVRDTKKPSTLTVADLRSKEPGTYMISQPQETEEIPIFEAQLATVTKELLDGLFSL